MRTAHEAALLFARVMLGLYFALAGWMKLSKYELKDGLGTFAKGGFADATPGWLPGWFATPYGYALPWAELIVGGLLVLGLCTRVQAGLVALMLLSFLIAMISNDAANVWQMGWPGPQHSNFVLLALALLLLTSGPGKTSVDALLRSKRGKKKGD